MRGYNVFQLFGLSLIFIVWAVSFISIASRPNPEDILANRLVQISFVGRASSKIVSDCLAYAVANALDYNTTTGNIADVKQNDVRNWFQSCMDAALSDLNAVSSSEGVVITSWNYNSFQNPACQGGSCSTVKATGVLFLDVNIPLTDAGFNKDLVVNGYQVNIDKEVNVIDTGYIIISTGRPQYRIIVKNLKTGQVEVNGLWPR